MGYLEESLSRYEMPNIPETARDKEFELFRAEQALHQSATWAGNVRPV